MKIHAIYIALIVLMFCAFYLAHGDAEQSNEQTNAIKSFKHQNDSLKKVIYYKDDTIEAVWTRMKTLEFERDQLLSKRKQITERYEKVKFVHYPTDSARLAILAELYSTINLH